MPTPKPQTPNPVLRSARLVLRIVYNSLDEVVEMSARRILGLSLLLGLTACVQQSATTAPKPLKPENGPNGSIQVSFDGGLINRTANAWFRVDQSAYVIVAHLGGDGVIRVLYPATPRQYGAVYTRKTLQTGRFGAEYDGAPHLYTFTLSPFRGVGARMDSYDGRGHGYVFMIATRSPLYVNEIIDGTDWDEVDVLNYYGASDPRLAIRDYAEMLTSGLPYTLKFASSFTSQSFTNYAANAADCYALAALGFAHLAGFWGSWGAPSLFLGPSSGLYSGYSACGPRHYASSYYDEPRRYYVPLPNPPAYPPPAPVAPTLQRPGFRPADRPTRAVDFGRSVLDRPTSASQGTSQRWRDIDRRRGARPSEESISRRDERGSRPGRATDEPRMTRPSEPRMTQPSEPRMTRPSETHTVDRPRTQSSSGSSDAARTPSQPTTTTKQIEKP